MELKLSESSSRKWGGMDEDELLEALLRLTVSIPEIC